MKIDSHTHIFLKNNTPKSIEEWFENKSQSMKNIYSTETLLGEMDDNDIKKSLVLPLSKRNNIKTVNNFMAKIQEANIERLICFGTINPHSAEESIKEIKRIKNGLDLKGIKLHPTLQEFFPNDKSLFKIYEVIEKENLPIIFHSGFGGLKDLTDKYSEPILLDEVACRFKDIKIIISHGGRYFFEQTAMMLRKHPNVYTEISTILPKNNINIKNNFFILLEFLEKIKKLNGDLKKVFFGSDYPFRGIGETLKILETIKDKGPYISNDDVGKILHKNFINCFGQNLKILEK
jgi:uncharacterized protein